MLVYVFRHGIAIDREDPDSPPEADRFLTDKGVGRTKESARGIRQLGIEPQLVLSSPWLRARQTADIATEVLELAGDVLLTEALLWNAPPDQLLAELSTRSVDSAMVVGHAPHLDELIAHAVGAPAPFTRLKKAGLAVLDLTSGESGTLIALYPARALRQLGGG